MQEEPGYMFDTTTFNKVLDNSIGLDRFPKSKKYYVTHIQIDQLKNTKNEARRKDLFEVFDGVIPSKLPTESASWDVSKWDEVKWPEVKPTESFVLGVSRLGMGNLGEDGNLYDILLEKLNNEKPSIRNKMGNIQDALIGETSIKNGFVLVTDDEALLMSVEECGGKGLRLRDFLDKS